MRIGGEICSNVSDTSEVSDTESVRHGIRIPSIYRSSIFYP